MSDSVTNAQQEDQEITKVENDSAEVRSANEHAPSDMSAADRLSSMIDEDYGSSTPADDASDDASQAGNAGNADFLENYAEFNKKRIYSSKLSDADYYWDNNSSIKDEFEKKYGDDARDEFDKYYETVQDSQRELVQEETDNLIVSSSMGTLFGDSEGVDEVGGATVEVTAETIGGAQVFDNFWTDQTRSVREQSVKSGQYLNDKGELVKLEEGEEFMSWTAEEGIIASDSESHKSSDGRKITGFEYDQGIDAKTRTDGHLKAVYEGDMPLGEVVSFWDATDSILASNSLDGNWASDIPKSVARTSISLTTDLAIGVSEMLNSAVTLLESDPKSNSVVNATRNFNTKLSRYKMSVTDYDQANTLSWSNLLDFTGQVAGQLLLAGGVAKSVGKLSSALFKGNRTIAAAKAAQAAGNMRKAERLFKTYERTVGMPSRIASLTAMSLMAGTSVKTEAIQKGFTEKEASGIFLAFLPAMYAASSISSTLDSSISTLAKKAEMQRVAKEMMAITNSAALGTNQGKFAFAKKVLGKMGDGIKKLGHKARLDGNMAGYGAAMTNEAMEEEVELIMEEGLKHLATGISAYTNKDMEKVPKFETIWDEGYFKNLFPKVIMSGVGGALGGGMAKFARMGGIDENTLPYKGEDKDKLKKLILQGGQNEMLFLKTLKDSYENGLLGTQDFLIERDENGKLKRTPEDRGASKVPTIAEANYKAILFQYNYYKAQIGAFNGTLDEFKKQEPELFDRINVDAELHERVKENFDKLSDLYSAATDRDAVATQSETRATGDSTPGAVAEASNAIRTSNTDQSQAEVGNDPNTTTNQIVEGVDETVDDSRHITEEAITLGNAMGVSSNIAQEILDREQLMSDMMVGKTTEEDMINAVVKSNAKFDSINGGEATPEPIRKYMEGGKSPVQFLNDLAMSDLRLRNEMARRHESYSKKSKEVTELIKNVETEADLQAILNAKTIDGTIPLNPTDIALLRSSMKNMANELITDEQFNTAATNAYTKYESNLVEDIKFNNKIVLDEDPYEALDDKVENDTAAFYKQAVRMKLEEEIVSQDVNRLLDLEITNDMDAFRTELQAKMLEYDVMPDDLLESGMGGNIFDIVLKEALGAVTTDMEQVVPDSDAAASIVRPIQSTVNEIENSISENVPNPVTDTGIEFLGNDFDMESANVQSTDNNLLNKAKRMEKEEVDNITPDYQVFKNLDGAVQLRDAIRVRKAAADLSKQLLDDQTLFKLRNYNANVFSDEEFHAPMNKDKYTQYSKYVSGFIMDPVELHRLSTEENRTDADEKKLAAMMRDYQYMYATPEEMDFGLQAQLDEALSIAEKLINLANESAEGQKMNEIYNSSVLHTAQDVVNTLTHSSVDLTGNVELHNLILGANIDTKNTSDENTIAQWKVLRQIAKHLYEADGKDAIFKAVSQFQNDDSARLVAAFLASDYNEFSADLQNIITEDSKNQPNPESPITPTIDQEMVAFSSFAFATSDKKYVQKFSGDSNRDSAVFATGKLGTGKTTMILGYAMKAIQNKLNKKVAEQFANGKLTGNMTDYNKVLLAANSSDQRTSIENTAKKFKLNVKDGGDRNSFNLEGLLKVLTEGDSYSKLQDVSTIVYDEVTFIEAFQSEDVDSDLDKILTSIDNINSRRVADGLPEIKFIGLGDQAQGGFHKGMTPGVENVHIDYSSMSNERQNISTFNVGKLSHLTTPFRAYVDELNAFIEQLKQFNSNTILGNPAPTVLKSNYNIISNDSRGRLGGVRTVSDSLSNIYGEQGAEDVAHIEAQIKLAKQNNEDFVVGIIDTYTDISEIPDGPLRQMAQKYPDNFKARTISQAQGGEYDYTLLTLPDDFLPKLSEFDGTDSHKFELVATMVGRSRFFTKIAMSDKINTDSTLGRVAMADQELSDVFKANWKAVRDASVEGLEISPQQEPDVTPAPEPTPDSNPDPVSDDNTNPEIVSKEVEEETNNKSESNPLNDEIKTASLKNQGDVEIESDPMELHMDDAVLIEYMHDQMEDMAQEFGVQEMSDQIISDLMRKAEQDMRDAAKSADERKEGFRTLSILEGVRSRYESLFDDQASTENDETSKSLFRDQDEEAGYADNERAKILDANGISIMYSRITKLAKYSDTGNPDLLKFYYANDIFGLGKVIQPQDIKSNTDAAMGIGPEGKRGMENYNYSLVTYKYKTSPGANGVMVAANVLVATTVDSNKKFIVSMLPKTDMMEPGSPTYKLFEDRANTLDKLQTKFTNTVTAADTSEYASERRFMTAFGDILPAGTIGGRQKSVDDTKMNTRVNAENRTLKLTDSIVDTGAVYMETDVTYDINKIIKGISPGALINSGENIKNDLISALSEYGETDLDYLRKMPLTDIEGNTDTVKGLEDIYAANQTFDKAAQKEAMESGYMPKVHGFDTAFVSHKANDGSTYSIFTLKSGNRLIPMLLTDSGIVTPVYGIDVDGSPILDTENVVLGQDPEVKLLSDIVNRAVIEKDTDNTSEASRSAIRNSVADMLHYSVAEYDRTVGMTSKFNLASKFNLDTATSSFDSHKITLNEFLKLNDKSNNPVRVSQPLVFTKDNSNTKSQSGSDAGKVFMFYTHNQSPEYDLSDPLVIQKLESKFHELGKHMEESASITPDKIASHLGDGIGVIQMDYDYNSLGTLMEHYKKSQEDDLAKFNKLIAPTGSEVNKRMTSFIGELSKLFRNTYGEIDTGDFKRIDSLMELSKTVNDEGDILSILNGEKESELQDYLHTVRNSADTVDQEAFNHLFKVLYYATADSNMGKVMLTGQLGDGYSPRIKELFLPKDDSEKARLFMKLLEDATDSEIKALKSLGVENLTPQEFLKIGSTTGEAGDTVKGRLLLRNGKPVIYPSHPYRDVFKYIPSSELDFHADGALGMKTSFSFNITNFMNLLLNGSEHDSVSDEVSQRTVEILDKLITDYTNKGTLNKGLRIPPSYTNLTGAKSAWGFLDTSGNGDNGDNTGSFYGGSSLLGDNLLTNIKAVEAPGVYMDTQALSEALTNAGNKVVDTTKPNQKESTLEALLESTLKDMTDEAESAINAIASISDIKEAKNIQGKANRKMTSIADAYVNAGGKEADLKEARVKIKSDFKLATKNAKTRLGGTTRTATLDINQLRSGEDILAADLRAVMTRQSTENAKKFDKLVDKLAIALDRDVLQRAVDSLDEHISTFTPELAGAVKANIAPHIDAITKNFTSTPTDFRAAKDYIIKNDVELTKVNPEEHKRLESQLNKYADGSLKYKSHLLNAHMQYEQESDIKPIEDFLSANLDSPLDPTALKFRIMRALRTSGYLLSDPESLTSVQTLAKLDPAGYKSFIEREDVKELLQNAQESTIIKMYSGAHDEMVVMGEFQTDVEDIINGDFSTDAKINYLQTLLDLVPAQFESSSINAETVKQIISQNMATLEKDLHGSDIVTLAGLGKQSDFYKNNLNGPQLKLIDNALDLVDQAIQDGELAAGNVLLALNNKAYVSTEYMKEFTNLLSTLKTKYDARDAKMIGKFLDNVKREIHKKNNKTC